MPPVLPNPHRSTPSSVPLHHNPAFAHLLFVPVPVCAAHHPPQQTVQFRFVLATTAVFIFALPVYPS